MENRNTLTDLFYFLLITGLSLFLFYFLSVLTAIPLFDVSLNDLLSSAINPSKENVTLLKYLQSVQSFGIFVVPPLIFVFIINKEGWSFLGLGLNTSSFNIIASVSLVFVFIPLVNFLVEINNMMNLPESLQGLEKWMRRHEDMNNNITELFLKTDSTSSTIINLFVLAVLPAFGEELMFRGAFQPIFSRLLKNKHLGVVIAAFIFSAIHFQFYGFIPRFLLGICFGYLVVWTESLWPAIVAHFVNNGFQVVYFSFNQNIGETNIETIGTSENLIALSLVSLILTAAVLYLIWKRNKQ